MRCHRCHATINDGDERRFHAEALCDDCYMDALSPNRPCDPWAVYHAKSHELKGGGLQLTNVQKEILRVLKETGGEEPGALAKALGLEQAQLDREAATLRHMEKIRGEKRDGQVVWRLW